MRYIELGWKNQSLTKMRWTQFSRSVQWVFVRQKEKGRERLSELVRKVSYELESEGLRIRWSQRNKKLFWKQEKRKSWEEKCGNYCMTTKKVNIISAKQLLSKLMCNVGRWFSKKMSIGTLITRSRAFLPLMWTEVVFESFSRETVFDRLSFPMLYSFKKPLCGLKKKFFCWWLFKKITIKDPMVVSYDLSFLRFFRKRFDCDKTIFLYPPETLHFTTYSPSQTQHHTNPKHKSPLRFLRLWFICSL